MPTYLYRCSACGSEVDYVRPIGDQPKTRSCECGSVRRLVLGVGMYIASDALPNKRHGVRATNAREARWDRDMPAYKDARDAGLQPRAVEGAAEALRGVEDQTDINYKLRTKEDKKLKNAYLDAEASLTGMRPQV